MNFHDSERLAGLLEARRLRAHRPTSATPTSSSSTPAACASAPKRSSTRGSARFARARGRDAATTPIVAVTGCVAQQEGERSCERGIVHRRRRRHAEPEAAAAARRARRANATAPQVDINPHDDVSFPLGVARHSDPVRAWVTIIEGCNEFCAFCVVPYTRGHERMRPVGDILAEVRRGRATGPREVQLLGQIVNHYQAPDDPSCDFAALLERVSDGRRASSASGSPVRIRGTSRPRLIAAIRDLPKVCKHLHLPVQSGSNRILQAMRRRYTRESLSRARRPAARRQSRASRSRPT